MARYTTRNSRFQPEMTEERVNRLLSRVKSGMGAVEAANSMGISVYTAKRIVKEHGGVRKIRNSAG